MNTKLLEQARKLSVNERIELVEAIWESLTTTGTVPVPTEAQTAELDRRLAEHEKNPDDVIPWEEIRSEAIARLRR